MRECREAVNNPTNRRIINGRTAYPGSHRFGKRQDLFEILPFVLIGHLEAKSIRRSRKNGRPFGIRRDNLVFRTRTQ
jgi:hypothetical protein